MKALLALLAFVGAFLAWQYYAPVQPANRAAHESTPHLAPEGVYFLRDYVSVPTKRGVTGWTPGQRVTLDTTAAPVAGRMAVTDGTACAVLDLTMLTDDVDEAQALAAQDQQTLAALQTQDLWAKAQRAREQLALHIEMARDIQAESVRNAAASAIRLTPNVLNEPPTYAGSASGGASYVAAYVGSGTNGGSLSFPAPVPVPVDLSHRANSHP